MTVLVPAPVPLEMPPGNPAAVEDLVEDVLGTASRLAGVATCLGSSSASVPNWRGADASATAAQVATVAELAEGLSRSAAAAAHRLAVHAECLLRVRGRVASLRARQEEDLRAAWGRLSLIQDHRLAAMTGGPEAVAVVEELEAAEAIRRREHGRLLDEVAEDAAATARVLADACSRVGGTGRRGGSGLVVAHLAKELPGWGEAELRRRGTALAEELAGLLPPAGREALAADALGCAGSPAFAAAFLTGLGVTGIRETLSLLGDGDLGAESALARTLALALGAATATAAAGGPVGDVLRATYVQPDDPGRAPDLVALGMGSVLAAGGRAGPRPETVLRWARQLLAREQLTGRGLAGVRAADRAHPLHGSGIAGDPLQIAVHRLARADEPAFAADLLGDRGTWAELLSRPWDDDAAALDLLVAQAGRADGAAGEGAVRAGLEALGGGLADGDPDGWAVDRSTAATIASSLGEAVAAQFPVAAQVLERGGGGPMSGRDGDALRGLGYLSIHEGATRAIHEGLGAWVQEQSGALRDQGPPTTVAVVPSAFVAVREYGQRLAHALHGFEQQDAARLREDRWAPVGLMADLAPGAWGVGLAVLDLAGARLLGADGTWETGRDEGRVFDRADGEQAALALSAPGAAETDLRRVAGEAFTTTADALGVPLPPTSPRNRLLQDIAEAAAEQSSGIRRRRAG